jgi:hypothetical protein
MVFSFFVFETYFIAISLIETNYSDYHSKQSNDILNKNLYRFTTNGLIGIKNKGYPYYALLHQSTLYFGNI